jgi:protoporphyrinogen oxidase
MKVMENNISSYTEGDVTLIVGAGMTGLTAATLLVEKGQKCLLIEKELAIGGACRSYFLDDIVFDMGPHIFLFNGQPAEKFMMELLRGEKIIKRRFRCAIQSKGRLWKFPVSIIDVMMYPWQYKKEMIAGFLKKKPFAPTGNLKGAISVEDEIIDKVGPAYYHDIFEKMLAAKTILTGNKLHMDWITRVDRNIKNRKEPFITLSRTDIVRKFLHGFFEGYYYPYDGFHLLANKLHNRYQKSGGETILECGPVNFEKNEERIVSATVKGLTYLVKQVIWTGSVNALNHALKVRAPEIRYIKSILVFLTYDRPKPVKRPYVYVYYSQEDILFNRVYYPYSIYREQSPPYKEGICLELNYFDEFDKWCDEEIVRRTVVDADKIGLFKCADLRYSHVVRLGESIPVYELDYEAKMQKAFRDVHIYNNLYSVGRQGGYFFCLSPAAVKQGMKAAEYILRK